MPFFQGGVAEVAYHRKIIELLKPLCFVTFGKEHALAGVAPPLKILWV